jgi:hypothetical protein
MRFRLTHACLVVFAAHALAASAADAFTVENKDEGGQYGVPKFNLEDQAKGFSKNSSDPYSTGKGFYETPLGNGKLQFGVTQGSAYSFGSGLSGFGPSGSRASRQDFDKMLAPPTSPEFYGVR